VIRTLRIYLAKDLARAAGVATVALTLVMTVIAVIEPLRERGLSSRQALRLFGYSMPVMVSLTLPIAALFAATIVYGRFSQDNEMMACRASGISTLAVLKPAIWLGLGVTVLTLLLGLYVAPRLLWYSRRTLENDLRSIVFHRLKTQGYVKVSSRIFHADAVDPQGGWLQGVVAVDFSDPDDVGCLVASSAELKFSTRDGRAFVMFHPTNPAVFRQSGGSAGMAQEQRLRHGELPDLFQEEPKLYDWTRLCRTWAQPRASSIVAKAVGRIKRQIAVYQFYRDLVARIREKHSYARLREFAPAGASVSLRWVEIRAPAARLEDDAVLLSGGSGSASGPASRPTGRVVVRLYEGRRLWRELRAAEVEVKGRWGNFRGTAEVALRLRDVLIRQADQPLDQALRQAEYEMGPFAIPSEVIAQAMRIDLDDLYRQPERYGLSRKIRRMISALDTQVIARLLAKVQAEMHHRLAYGVSCMLMVMLGAALGLMLGHGQILAAFAVSAIPGSAVHVLLLMGRQLIANPGVPSVYGIAAIWGGVGALAAATLFVYVVYMRR